MQVALRDRLARRSLGKACACTVVLVAAGLWSPLRAQEGNFALLDSLQKGAWELRYRDGSPSRRICLRTGREFIQLRHASAQCGRYTVDGAGDRITVQYSCKGDGYGRTTVRKETGGLVQLEGQGIAGGLPYQFAAEARRVGSC